MYIASLKSLAPNIAAEFPGGEYYNIVPSTQASVAVQTSAAYGFLPDGGFFYDTGSALSSVTAPIPSGVVYENMTTPNADHHMMVLEQGSCLLYELYAENPSSATTGWDVMVEWNLNGSPEIPGSYDIGSTTQAGTPLLPGSCLASSGQSRSQQGRSTTRSTSSWRARPSCLARTSPPPRRSATAARPLARASLMGLGSA
jgi:hypothetical protein